MQIAIVPCAELRRHLHTKILHTKTFPTIFDTNIGALVLVCKFLVCRILVCKTCGRWWVGMDHACKNEIIQPERPRAFCQRRRPPPLAATHNRFLAALRPPPPCRAVPAHGRCLQRFPSASARRPAARPKLVVRIGPRSVSRLPASSMLTLRWRLSPLMPPRSIRLAQGEFALRAKI